MIIVGILVFIFGHIRSYNNDYYNTYLIIIICECVWEIAVHCCTDAMIIILSCRRQLYVITAAAKGLRTHIGIVTIRQLQSADNLFVVSRRILVFFFIYSIYHIIPGQTRLKFLYTIHSLPIKTQSKCLAKYRHNVTCALNRLGVSQTKLLHAKPRFKNNF